MTLEVALICALQMQLHGFVTTVRHSLKCLTKEIYEFLCDLSPPIMNDMFTVKENMYKLRKFHATVKFGTDMVMYRGPQIWNLIPNITNISSCQNLKWETKK